MLVIVRVLCLSVGCALAAGWVGREMFLEYPDYWIPAILLALAGGLVGGVAGASYEVTRTRTTGVP